MIAWRPSWKTRGAYRVLSPEEYKARQKKAKQKYYTSEKGKAQKRKEEAAYKASGKRAQAEARREAKPLSEARKAARKRWAERNKWFYAADRAHRRMLSRHPVSDGDKVEMDGMYLFAQCFPWFQVDHVVPVKGKMVSGLHVLGNLQVISATENKVKSNRFCPAGAEMVQHTRIST